MEAHNTEYKIILRKESEEEGIRYKAFCKELGEYSCYGIGDTITEAISNFNIVKEDFILTLIARGKEIPKPYENGIQDD